MSWNSSIAVIASVFLMTIISKAGAPPPAVAKSVDLKKYMGRWYEVARYPNGFQKKCWGDVVVEYELRPDGTVGVTNTCRKNTPDGSITTANGVATLVDPNLSSKLKVKFEVPFLPFLHFPGGDYWILLVDPDYRFAAVGGPDRKYLWILSRTPAMNANAYAAVLKQLTDNGYDVNKLIKTPQQGK